MEFKPVNKQTFASLLRQRGIRVTAQRLNVAATMMRRPQHLSADEVWSRVNGADASVSRATVYNTLSLFVDKGLIGQVQLAPKGVLYDSNTAPHGHLYNEDTGALTDFNTDAVGGMPALPEDTVTTGVDMIVRVKNCR